MESLSLMDNTVIALWGDVSTHILFQVAPYIWWLVCW